MGARTKTRITGRVMHRGRRRPGTTGACTSLGSGLVLDLCLREQSRRHYQPATIIRRRVARRRARTTTHTHSGDWAVRDLLATTTREKWVIIVLSACHWHGSLEQRYIALRGTTKDPPYSAETASPFLPRYSPNILLFSASEVTTVRYRAIEIPLLLLLLLLLLLFSTIGSIDPKV